jgi:hypothetical protein
MEPIHFIYNHSLAICVVALTNEICTKFNLLKGVMNGHRKKHFEMGLDELWL